MNSESGEIKEQLYKHKVRYLKILVFLFIKDVLLPS